jgi:hypothetical protein
MEFKIKKTMAELKTLNALTAICSQKHQVGWSRFMVVTNIRMLQSGSRSVARTASFEMI